MDKMRKKILILAGDFTEDYEVMVPFQTLGVFGLHAEVACPGKKAGESIKTAVHDFEGDQTYTEKPGHRFVLNADFAGLQVEEYAGLYLTGGRSPEYLRLNDEVLDIVRYFMKLSRPVAAICHGVQLLTAADVVRGRRLTAYPAVRPEVEMAGGIYIEKQADESVADANLVTSPAWPGNTAILRDFVGLLGISISCSMSDF
ncbi:MAG: DJ-1/PfpI family protein [bacterium]